VLIADASTLTDYLLGRAHAVEAMEAAMRGDEHEPLHAPALIEPEVLNALRGILRRGAISDRRADEAVSDLGSMRMVLYPHGYFRERVWALRDNLSAYDALYLSLAEQLDDSLLLTGDSGLATIARGLLGPDRVALVA
jgi:predicted nucleic acid-binding protein